MSVSLLGLWWVDWGSLVGDIGDESVISVGGVLDVLDSAIGKSNGVRSGNVAGTIGSLLSVEGRLGVVIGNSVGELVGGLLSKVISNISSLHWGMVSWGSMSNNWGMISWCSMGNNRGRSILSLAIIGDISNITILIINVIVDMLNSAIRKSNRVGSFSSTSTIRGLSSLEVSL